MLSALEGVEQIAPTLQPYVLPAAVAILLALFAMQSRGTAAIGRAFGPIMLLWFVAIAALGVHGVLQHPTVFAAVDPALRPRLSVERRIAGTSASSAACFCA